MNSSRSSQSRFRHPTQFYESTSSGTRLWVLFRSRRGLGNRHGSRTSAVSLALGLTLLLGATKGSTQVSNFWIGTSGNWTDGTKWSQGAAPGAFDITLFT